MAVFTNLEEVVSVAAAPIVVDEVLIPPRKPAVLSSSAVCG